MGLLKGNSALYILRNINRCRLAGGLSRGWVTGLFAVLVSLGLFPVTQSSAQEIAYLEYHRYSLKLAERDDTPQLRIYPSGRVETYHPAYSPKAGRYAMELPANELAGLWQSLQVGGLFELNSGQIRAEQRAAEQERRQQEGTLYYSSDATVTYLQVRLPGEPEVQLEFENLQSESSRLPGVASMNRLAAIERRLWKLRDDPRLKRFANPAPAQGR